MEPMKKVNTLTPCFYLHVDLTLFFLQRLVDCHVCFIHFSWLFCFSSKLTVHLWIILRGHHTYQLQLLTFFPFQNSSSDKSGGRGCSSIENNCCPANDHVSPAQFIVVYFLWWFLVVALDPFLYKDDLAVDERGVVES